MATAPSANPPIATAPTAARPTETAPIESIPMLIGPMATKPKAWIPIARKPVAWAPQAMIPRAGRWRPLTGSRAHEMSKSGMPKSVCGEVLSKAMVIGLSFRWIEFGLGWNRIGSGSAGENVEPAFCAVLGQCAKGRESKCAKQSGLCDMDPEPQVGAVDPD